MGRRYTETKVSWLLAVIALVLVFAVGLVGSRIAEDRLKPVINNAGEQVTAHTKAMNTAQVYMNGQWYAERNVETMLVMGIDDFGEIEETDSYNNNHQTDFLTLFLWDLDTGRTSAIHLNRDTMTNITTLGVTGQKTGSRYAQLALAYNYGSGDHVSSENTAAAVEHLLYGMNVDHYFTMTMDAVPILNDWAGGVMVEVLDDFTEIDPELIQGELVLLEGQQALTYVRTRRQLQDSTNLHRMERQRQYASELVRSAHDKLSDTRAVAELVMQLNSCCRTNCTAEKLQEFAQNLGNNPNVAIHEIQGEAVQGETYIEFYADEEELQQLILELFYVPVIE